MRTLQYLSTFLASALLCAPLAQSQTLVLTCKTKITKEFAARHTSVYESLCTKSGEFYCQLLATAKAEVKKCVTSGLGYTHKSVYRLDKSVLNSASGGSAEVTNHPCWQNEEETRKVIVDAMPTLISFKEKSDYFIVDRTTLMAGWQGLEKKFLCEVSEEAVKIKI
jgi:hypothetical protein